MRGNCCAIQAVRYVIHALVLFYYYFDFLLFLTEKSRGPEGGSERGSRKGGPRFVYTRLKALLLTVQLFRPVLN